MNEDRLFEIYLSLIGNPYVMENATKRVQVEIPAPEGHPSTNKEAVKAVYLLRAEMVKDLLFRQASALEEDFRGRAHKLKFGNPIDKKDSCI